MGSFLITLKTINRAGIYTRSWDPASEQGTPTPSALNTRTPTGTAISISPTCIHPHRAACSKGLLQTQSPFKITTSMQFYHQHLITARISGQGL